MALALALPGVGPATHECRYGGGHEVRDCTPASEVQESIVKEGSLGAFVHKMNKRRMSESSNILLRIITLRDTSGLSGILGSDTEVRRVQTWSVRTGLGFNFEGVAPAPYAMPNLQKGGMRVPAQSKEV